jgi:dipeptidyl aminopeptidase/acylaminoacyl peptidase
MRCDFYRRLVSLLLFGLLAAGCVSQLQDTEAGARGAAVSERREGALILRDVPEVPVEVRERLRQYQNTRSARARGWIGDGLLIATRFGESSQLHLVEQPQGARRQVTFFAEPVSQAYVSPQNDEGFIFARDAGGSEFYQLFWFDWKSGEHRLLTDGKSRYGSVVWGNGGDRFAYYTTERNGRSRDVHVQGLDGGITVALEEDEGAWFPEDFSPEDDRLLISRYVSINESYLYEVDLRTGGRRVLLDEGLEAAIGQARYDADGRGIYFTSDLGAEFVRLHHLDLESGDIEVLTSDVSWNVEAFELSEDRSLLALAMNEGGLSRLRVWQLPDRRPIALPPLPTGVLSGLAFSAAGDRLAVSLSTPTSPTDVWSLGLEDRTLVRWTESEIGGLDPASFAAPELVSFDTFDEVGGAPRQIPAFVYRPAAPGPHPVLISIHGGPEGQYRPRFSSTVQYLVGELGMAVIAPNVRGSAGYGKSFLKLDNGVRREDSVLDIGALLDWVSGQEDLDPAAVVVQGGSYGGYMVLASLVHYSDRLTAGIESVGISNFVTFLNNTQPYRQDLRRAEYGDERDPEMRAHLEAISPLNRVDDIEVPLLISQGANDPRVPASESEQIFAALKSRGVPVWYVLAEDEGHGFRKKSNRDYDAAVRMMFLEEFVLECANGKTVRCSE